MPAMRPSGIALVCLALLVAVPAAARAAPKETYIFELTRVDLAKGVPADVARQVSARLAKAIDAHAELDAALPAGAPNPDAAPEPFKGYMKKHHQRAFKVNVEVTEYASEVEPATKGAKGDQLLTVRVALKLFGETIPDRVMAFTGDGAAAVKVEIGKTLRPADQDYANDQALELAIADALKTSITRLREPPPSQKNKKGKKKAATSRRRPCPAPPPACRPPRRRPVPAPSSPASRAAACRWRGRSRSGRAS
jgi:hypothetical protein